MPIHLTVLFYEYFPNAAWGGHCSLCHGFPLAVTQVPCFEESSETEDSDWEVEEEDEGEEAEEVEVGDKERLAKGAAVGHAGGDPMDVSKEEHQVSKSGAP